MNIHDFFLILLILYSGNSKFKFITSSFKVERRVLFSTLEHCLNNVIERFLELDCQKKRAITPYSPFLYSHDFNKPPSHFTSSVIFLLICRVSLFHCSFTALFCHTSDLPNFGPILGLKCNSMLSFLSAENLFPKC